MKKALKLSLLTILLLPFIALAQTGQIDNTQNKYYQAQVIEITKQEQTVFPDGTVSEQQNLKLRGLEREIKDKEIEFKGIGNYDVVNKNIYKKGEKVLVVESADFEGNKHYYITDYIRTGGLWLLAGVFGLSLFLVGGWKGLRSIFSLALTFLIIIKYIIPKILDGSSPVAVTIIGSFVILLLIIYITEGFNRKAHIAVLSIFFSLIITIIVSKFFVFLTKLSGFASEETSYLVEVAGREINFQGLLLAGIIIGALGVLDDVVISQISAAEQIHSTDKTLTKRKLFKKTYEVGISHVSSMTNTLFLAYAGVSMPLLILFLTGQSAFGSWGQVVNNEAIATEIVRTLAGSIGLILSVPISTFMAAWFLNSNKISKVASTTKGDSLLS